jgi:hypothetical protein
MPLGHLVDLLWKFRSALVILGATLIAMSLLIMSELIQSPSQMSAYMSVGSWYVLSTILAPIGYVLQDAVADAMTAEAVPRIDSDSGQPLPTHEIHAMHVTMQTLGRVAFVGGTILVALINLWVFSGSAQWSPAEKVNQYRNVYLYGLSIPIASVTGLILAWWFKEQEIKKLTMHGYAHETAKQLMVSPSNNAKPNPLLLIGSLMFVIFTVSIGLSDLTYGQEIIFVGSMLIVLFLMARLMSSLEAEAKQYLIGTALVIFLYRATPGPGPGVNWWSIDVLGFDQSFFSVLSLIGGILSLIGMLALRTQIAKYSVTQLTIWLCFAGTVLSIPQLAMSFGFHEWTAAHTQGLVDARFIAVIDTALESPLSQIAMIPLLTWIAQSAYFAVMTSFANLALSASQLMTKYMNQIFVINREIKDSAGLVLTPSSYGELSHLLIFTMTLGLLMPIIGVVLVKMMRLKSA